MEIRNIATFLKVAGTQNFSKAAEQLGYSQSAVTDTDTTVRKRIRYTAFLKE